MAGALLSTAVDARSPYKVRLAVDLPMTIALIGGATTLDLVAPDSVMLSCHPCDESTLNPLDRGVVGPMSRTSARVTDAMVTLAIASPFILSAVDERWGQESPGAAEWLTDGLVIAEAMGVTLMLTQIAKYAVKRPRPFTYLMDPGDSAEVPIDDSLSFYSGHTAMAFAGVVSGLATLRYRGVKGGAFVGAAGAGLVLAAGVGFGRVAASRHFWTDVMTGAVVGSLMGWLVPWLHLREDGGSQSEGAGLALQAAPLGVSGSF